MQSLHRVLAVLQFLLLTNAKTIDNRLVGLPKVECGSSKISFSAETEEVFEGQLYIKGYRRFEECYTLFESSENTINPSFSLPLSKLAACGIDMQRKPNKAGLKMSMTFVVAFHPNFVTSGDRAFAVNCVYQPKDVRVHTDVDISESKKPSLLVSGFFEELSAEMNIIRAGSVTKSVWNLKRMVILLSKSVKDQVDIGEQLLIIWSVQQPTSNFYGVRVQDCDAETSDGNGMRILTDGCSLDQELVSDVSYSQNFDRAFAELIAFRFPENDEIFFRCTLKPCLRRFEHLHLTGHSEEDLCSSKPKCEEPGPGRNRRESIRQQLLVDENVIAVNKALRIADSSALKDAKSSANESRGFCVPSFVYLTGLSTTAIFYVTTFFIVSFYTFKSRKH
ncbi:unnamed protein product [Caenorhabditis auriculariae]|uniref:ZP domain-containing protein n=1 Tax=Caenorhabditis auriculariae TaxID=2777116 RepID=A0A8S1HT22_9PELO|nr:unnamed protein product [Caenorhabditis auriculariae]